MNKNAHRIGGRLCRWAAVIGLTLAGSGSWAARVVINSAELNAALDANESEITLGAPGVYTVIAPRMITGQDLTINSLEAPLVTAYEFVLESSGGSVGAMFDLMPDTGSFNASFQGVRFQGGAPYVKTDGNMGLSFNRCYFDGGARAVELVAPTKDVTFSQCIFDGSAPGVFMTGGNSTKVVFYQCTIFGGPLIEGTGNGTVAMTLCLFEGMGAPAFNLDPAISFEWAYSVYGQSASTPVAVTGNDFQFTRPSGDLATPPSFDLASPWRGKLLAPVSGEVTQTNTNVGSAFGTVGPDALLDFELEPRFVNTTTQLGVGADEFNLSPVTKAVTGVTVTGGNRDFNGNVIVGPETPLPVTITINTLGVTLDDALVYVVPATADPNEFEQFSPAQITITDNSHLGQIVATFRPPGTCFNDVLQDGVGRVVLYAEGRYWPNLPGTADDDDQVFARDGDMVFVIDTTPPRLSGGGIANTGLGILSASNDNNGPPIPGLGFEYPEGWSPWVDSPWSGAAGSIAVGPSSGGPIAQVFLNPTGVLDFAATIAFDDPPPPPCVVGGIPLTNGGGFADPGILALPSIVNGSDIDLLKDFQGIARLQENGLESARLRTANAAIDFASHSQYVAVTTFAFNGIPTIFRSESMELLFEATDAAGNKATIARPFRLWWLVLDDMRVATSNNNSGDEVNIGWNVSHSSRPTETFPAYPIGRFRLFRSINPTFGTTEWKQVTDWSEWSLDREITRQSIVSGTQRLGDFLDQPDNYGEVMLAFQVADEAGNFSPIANSVSGLDLDQADPFVPTTEIVRDAGIPFETWTNGQSSSGYDTAIEALYWYNNIRSGNLRRFEPQFGEVSFGDAGRIPIIPETECDFRIEAQFTLTPSFPLTTAIPGTAGVAWDLYEDNRLVAQGWVTGTEPLTIPQDILVPGSGNGVTVLGQLYLSPTPSTAFLNTAPDDCDNILDRLGDDGEKPDYRRREVRYTLVAYTVSEVNRINPEFIDTSPATVQFSVYVVDETGVGNPPVKSFTKQ